MATTNLEIISKTRVIEAGYDSSSSSSSTEYENGCYHRVSHQSTSTSTKMIFGLFLPSTFKNECTCTSNIFVVSMAIVNILDLMYL